MSDRLACVIPARGGSKRLPQKNITSFFGHPLLAYTIAAAKRSGLFARVVVSTDDPAIGAIAERYGAEYLRRPDEFATDNAGLVEVAEHFLDHVASTGTPAAAFCQLMPNCPLRRSEDIVEHERLFREHKRAFQISMIPYRGVYPQWATVTDETGAGRWFFGEQYLVQSQALAEVWCPTGAIWWARTADFRTQRKFYGWPYHVAPMDANRGIDIDHREELELAEILVRGLRDRDGVSPLEPIDA